jgi:AraC-like DNA-binding protein
MEIETGLSWELRRISIFLCMHFQGVMELLYIASSVLSLFFIMILAGKRNKSNSDIILICWFVLLFSNVLSFYLIIKNVSPMWLVMFLDHSVFLHGPLLFLYTSALTGVPRKPLINTLLHFIPFFFFLIISSWLNLINWEHLEVYQDALISLKFIAPFIYILISLRIIHRHRQHLAYLYSSNNHLELKWLSGVLYGFIVVIIVGVVTMFLYFFTSVNIPQFGGQYLNIAYSISIILLGYFGFRQTAIFIPSHIQSDHSLFTAPAKNEKAKKYKKSRLNEEFAARTYRSLLNHMDREKPFTDNNLTLFKLAEQLDISENKLSQVINTQSRCNFFEFINKYRVDLVVEKMKSHEHENITLLGLALDSGFNSKASFNRAFKKVTGLTPSEFLRSRGIHQLHS